MTTPRTPAGHSTVSPYVLVPDARAAIAFVEKVFGATVILLHDRPDGSVMHASVGIGDAVVMIADAAVDYPPVPAWIHVYVDDVDSTFAEALALGAVAVQEPSEKGDGDRRGGFADAFGITWWVAQPLE